MSEVPWTQEVGGWREVARGSSATRLFCFSFHPRTRKLARKQKFICIKLSAFPFSIVLMTVNSGFLGAGKLGFEKLASTHYTFLERYA